MVAGKHRLFARWRTVPNELRQVARLAAIAAVLSIAVVSAGSSAHAEIAAPAPPQPVGEGAPTAAGTPGPDLGGSPSRVADIAVDAPSTESANMEECAEFARSSIKKENGLAAAGVVLLALCFLMLRHVIYRFDFGLRSPVGRFLLLTLIVVAVAIGIGASVRRFGTYHAGQPFSVFQHCKVTVEADSQHELAVGPEGRRIRVEKVKALYGSVGVFSSQAAGGIGAGAGLVAVLIGWIAARIQYARRAKERV